VAAWRFEVVLAVKEADEATEAAEADEATEAAAGSEAKAVEGAGAAVGRFDFRSFPAEGGGGEGAPAGWRCRSCYATRFKTFCFGINPPTADAGASTSEGGGVSADACVSADAACVHCGVLRRTGGWSVWLPHDALPGGWMRTVTSRYGPPIVPLLRTKWPAVHVTLATEADAALPSV